jgi:hypothetical protein
LYYIEPPYLFLISFVNALSIATVTLGGAGVSEGATDVMEGEGDALPFK